MMMNLCTYILEVVIQYSICQVFFSFIFFNAIFNTYYPHAVNKY